MSMRYPGGFIASTPVTAAYPSGVWTQAQAIPYQAQNVWTRDQYWPYTTLLLQGNGTNGAQNNTFLDSSSNNFTITRNGNTTQGAFTPYEQDGYWSNYFDGSGDYLSVADNTALTLTGDHTIEAFVYLTAYSANYSTVVARWQASGTQEEFLLWIGSTGTVEFYFRPFGAGTPLLSGGTVNRNSWTHIAVVRSGNDWALFVGGSRVATATNSGVYTDTTATLTIGSLRSTYTQYDLTGYISNVRLVKGTAVYAQSSTTLTVPAAPLTAITNTSLLTCQSNRFKDNSTNNFTVTPNGDTSVQAFQPFPGATTWSASVLGGSGYFDGNGDYLSVASNAAFGYGTGDFTIECWFNIDSIPGGSNGSFLIDQRTTGSQAAICAYVYADSTLVLVVNGGVVITGGTVIPKQWNHFALARSGTTTKMFLNGVQVGSNYTDTNNYASLPVIIGARFQFDANQFFPGYISNFRILKGTALYTTTFTPPTTPLTAITNTSLLLNMTNAGIYDNSMMNDLETVGNAQVSTSVVKYGTGSMAFDGTGDYLVSNSATTDLYAFGTGDFTLEFWLYLNSASGVITLFDPRNSSETNCPVVYMSSGVLYFYVSGVNVITGATLSTSTWYHIALARSGSSTKLFVNGTQSGSTYTDTNNYVCQSNRPIIGANGYVSGGGVGIYALNGYIDDLRITKGAARYITNFTPPIARLPAQ